MYKGGVVQKEAVTPTLSWSASGESQIDDLPYHKDIVALGCEVTMQVDSGSSVARTDDNEFAIISELSVLADGNEIINLKGRELKWVHQMMFKSAPDSKHTPSATAQADQSAWCRFVVPVGAKRGDYNTVSLKVKWGAIADLDAGTSFNVDSATMHVMAYLGTAIRKFRTFRHSTTVNGDAVKVIPQGRLLGVILQTNGGDDYIDTIKFRHNGVDYFNGDYEQLRMDTCRLFDTTLLDVDGNDRALGIIDTMGLPIGSNSTLHFKTSQSDTVYSLYIYAE
jgi:hypothetical protein